MGGTRFVGKPLVEKLLLNKHELTLFTRGRNPIPENVEHIVGDRSNNDELEPLRERSFDVIIDSSGRNQEQTQQVIEVAGVPKYRFLYVSSAGVYASSEEFPLDEETPLDPSSRHSGKARTESWLIKSGIPFTSFRPTYIYGPGNYNPIERWFFERILHERPLPIPGNGEIITQLGHVDDLAEAMVKSLEVDQASDRIYNCSGKKGITFLGLISLCAIACGKDPSQIKTYQFDPMELDPKARKVFPLRLSHFFADIQRIEKELNWTPKFDLESGLADSFTNDYLLNPSIQPDFSIDKSLIGY